MYPRLNLQKLIDSRWVIFLSIDGTEVSNLEHLLNNVFGEENKITSICWQKKYLLQMMLNGSVHHDFIWFMRRIKIFGDPKSLNVLANSYLIIRTLIMILKENGILQHTHVIKDA
jgi:adenine-specific DNA-methyltransferase